MLKLKTEARMRRLRTLDEEIAEKIRQASESGELQSAKGYGAPLEFGDGYAETPADLRMGFKILKDAGFVPVEVELLRELNNAKERLTQLDPMSQEACDLRSEISLKETSVRIRLSGFRS